MNLNLERYAYFDNYVLGKLTLSNTVLHTMEREWAGNQRNVSCIPSGHYRVIRRTSEKYGKHWILCDVPERVLILIHSANWADQLKGCIAPGLGLMWDTRKGCHMVTHSRDAMTVLESELQGLDEFSLSITTFIPEYP